MDARVTQKVPYFSQWETPDMTLAVVAEGAQAALLRDPLWASSGAASVEDMRAGRAISAAWPA